MKVKLLGIGGKNLTNKHPFLQANCLQILVESPWILSLHIFATGPTFLTFNQTHYERNDLIGWIAFEVCNAKTYELFISTNVYKRFDPRVMEREERIGINGGLPTMDKNKISIIIVAGLILFPRYNFISFLLPYIW
jgi:hypothetical protein